MSNIVYIGTSIDGYISAPDGSLDWLSYVPIPEGNDLGFSDFMERVDVVAMGRITFETVLGFDMGWPYPVPGLVLSTTMTSVPPEFEEHVEIVSGTPSEIVELGKERGFNHFYVDGGKTVQQFLRDDLIDEMIISEIPVLLGGGDRLFGKLDQRLDFELVDSHVLVKQIVKRHYQRKSQA